MMNNMRVHFQAWFLIAETNVLSSVFNNTVGKCVSNRFKPKHFQNSKPKLKQQTKSSEFGENLIQLVYFNYHKGTRPKTQLNLVLFII